MDMLSGEQFYSDNFKLIETSAFNERFEALGYETMTFALNSGSFTIMLFFVIVTGAIKKVLLRLALKFPYYRSMRLLGMKCQSNDIFGPSVRLIFETYLEILICSTFGILDMFFTGRPFYLNFSTPGYALNATYVIVFSVIAATFPFWGIRKILTNFDKLEDEEFMSTYGPLYEDLKTSNKS